MKGFIEVTVKNSGEKALVNVNGIDFVRDFVRDGVIFSIGDDGTMSTVETYTESKEKIRKAVEG